MRKINKLRQSGGKGKWKKGNNSKRAKPKRGRKRPRSFNKKQQSIKGKMEGASCPDMTRLLKSEKLSVFGWTLTRSIESKTVERMANLLFVEKCRQAI